MNTRKSLPDQKSFGFEFREAVRYHTWTVRDNLVSKVMLSPTLRRMLMAIHSYCKRNEKRHCWPSIGTLTEDLGYQWPQARRTVQRQIERLKEYGLLLVEQRNRKGAGERGQTSSVYAIRYGALRRLLPDDCKYTQPRGGGCSTAGGRHSNRGGAVTQPPHELIELEIVNRNADDDTREQTPAPERTNGGGGLRTIPATPTAGLASRKSGWWIGIIGDLANRDERSRVFAAAVAAGLLTDCPIDRVRFATLELQSRLRPPGMAPGFIVSHVEAGDWDWLDPASMKDALRRLGFVLTKEELLRVRTREPRSQTIKEPSL
ncbi:MAG: helix-turn-helix domain-containing protein [Planctomycetota bacterium]